MLRLTDVSKRYKNHFALKNININIEKGKLYLFVGENGSGKSTTIKLISRVIFNNSGGTIENDFEKIVYLPDKCSYPNLLNVKTYLSMYLSKSTNINKIEEKMKEYHLENKMIASLSKGMLQKLGILQTILSNADLYIFDEPLNGLDKVSTQKFKSDIKKLIENEKTVIISTHSRMLFRDLTPNVIKFKGGLVNEKTKA